MQGSRDKRRWFCNQVPQSRGCVPVIAFACGPPFLSVKIAHARCCTWAVAKRIQALPYVLPPQPSSILGL